MDRLACVDLPELPLQLLLRRHPQWQRFPVAVVDQDRPQGRLLWVNARARRSGILPGTTYAAAHSLSGELRAAEVPQREVEQVLAAVVRELQRVTPGVEPFGEEPGVFWLDGRGLERLHGSWSAWAEGIRAMLWEQEHLKGVVVVGFTQFGTFAVARGGLEAREGIRIFHRKEEEVVASHRVALERLLRNAEVRELLAKLGVRTVGKLAELPPEGVERRFGRAVRELHALARRERPTPLQPLKLEEPLRELLHLDYGERDLMRLAFLAERLMQPLLRQLASRSMALAEVCVELVLENRQRLTERLRPAAPTLDPGQIQELIELRLGSLSLEAPVGELGLSVEGVLATSEQLELFAETSPRDLDAAARALARLRAELGDSAVVRPQLRSGHLPEASYSWERLSRVPRARPEESARPVLVRRVFEPSLPLPSRPRHEPDGWILRGLEQGPVVRVHGPYVVSGGWWRKSAHREYHFAETQKGEILWVYYDRPKRRWFLQGRVE